MSAAIGRMNDWSATLWTAMLRSCLQAAILVAVTWLLTRLVRRLPAHVRAWLWWAACLRLMLGIVWVYPITLRILPREQAIPTSSQVASWSPSSIPETSPKQVSLAAVASPSPTIAKEVGRPQLSPVAAAAVAWAVLVATIGTIGISRWRRTCRVLRSAVPCSTIGDAVCPDYGRIVQAAGLRRPPPVLTAETDDGPFVAGVLRPAIVLPNNYAERFEPAELRMALAHELAHVRRCDLWTSLVAAATRALYFYFPPA